MFQKYISLSTLFPFMSKEEAYVEEEIGTERKETNIVVFSILLLYRVHSKYGNIVKNENKFYFKDLTMKC